MRPFPYVPQDYRYREVPVPVYPEGSREDSVAYCNWLAAHLQSQEFALSPAQALYARSLEGKSPEGIAITLADDLGYNIFPRDILERLAREGKPYSEIERLENEQQPDPKETDPEVYDSWKEAKTTRAEYELICREVEEEDRIGNVPNSVDIPIRSLLALAVKKCKDLNHAEEVIRLFYDTFNESASK